MLKKIALVLGALIVVLCVVIALQPKTLHITRSITIAAPAAAVYEQVADFRKWAAWSPWEKLDPAMEKTYGSNTYAWKGNDKVGQGQMTILASQPPSSLSIKLEFFKPRQDTSTTTFSFTPAGAGTQVTWTMDGEKDFLSKAVCMVMDLDKMVGGDFEKGLAQLKSVAETQPVAVPAVAK